MSKEQQAGPAPETDPHILAAHVNTAASWPVRVSPMVRAGDVMLAGPDMNPINLRRHGVWANAIDYTRTAYILIASSDLRAYLRTVCQKSIEAGLPAINHRKRQWLQTTRLTPA
jgi:hypothetical protein